MNYLTIRQLMEKFPNSLDTPITFYDRILEWYPPSIDSSKLESNNNRLPEFNEKDELIFVGY